MVENVREEMEKIMNEAVLLVRDQADRCVPTLGDMNWIED